MTLQVRFTSQSGFKSTGKAWCKVKNSFSKEASCHGLLGQLPDRTLESDLAGFPSCVFVCVFVYVLCCHMYLPRPSRCPVSCLCTLVPHVPQIAPQIYTCSDLFIVAETLLLLSSRVSASNVLCSQCLHFLLFSWIHSVSQGLLVLLRNKSFVWFCPAFKSGLMYRGCKSSPAVDFPSPETWHLINTHGGHKNRACDIETEQVHIKKNC